MCEQGMLRGVEKLWSRVRGRPARRLDASIEGEMFGGDYGGYCVCTRGLDARSVVYSFGIGEDLSFDQAMVERFGLTVHAFDPTPRSIAWVEAQRPEGIVFHPYGLLDRDGVVRFNPPKNTAHVSHSVLDEDVSDRITGDGALELQVKRLRSVMRALGHERVDVLKMDIEGAEYAVIDDVVASSADVGQLLLEFHHQLPGIALSQTEAAIDRLARAGFRPFHVSATGREWSFIRT